MKTFKIAWYKAKIGDGKVLDDGISAYTTFFNALGLVVCLQFKMAWQVVKRRYSHVEIWWPDKDGNFRVGKRKNNKRFLRGRYIHSMEYSCVGECFTSTMRGNYNGTIIRPASEIFKHPKRWDITTITISDKNFERAKNWAIYQAVHNLGYNKKTIGSFFNPFRKTKKPDETEQNICSVASQGFSWMAGLFKIWHIWSPIKFWWKINKLGFKTEPLAKC